MKYSRLVIYAAAAAMTISSCAVRKPQNLSSDSNLVRDGKLWSSLWQQRAAEYKALCFQAFNIARLRLDAKLQGSPQKPLAIVTDIDETVLDNSPNAVQQALEGKNFEQAAWYNWTNKAACDTVAGAVSFFKYASSRGVSIFYITNRDEKERDATLKNLRFFNFPDADNNHLLLKQTSSGKETRRQEVLKTHDIVLLLGDNLSDFSAIFDKLPEGERTIKTREYSADFGNRFIVLPNANYGDWENSLFHYDYKLTEKQKEEIIKGSLKRE